MTLVGPELDAVFCDDDYNAQLFSAEIGGEEDELDCLPSVRTFFCFRSNTETFLSMIQYIKICKYFYM